MSPEIIALFAEYLHPAVYALLGIAGLCFVVFFLVPGFLTAGRLRGARKALLEARSKGPVLDLDKVRGKAMIGTALEHCWSEYRDTLHGQKQPNATGMLEVTRWRATALSKGFFTEQALVDAPLRTEFYKHLPGILTGIGIIGTFSGLIVGLQSFGQVLTDPTNAGSGLRALLDTVGGAFIVSGSAIALAMLLTTIEKIIVNVLYTRLEALCGTIDSLFDAGAGEEYLQRLVEASETSATQTMQMKESLVTELKQVLTELSSQQVAAIGSTSRQLEHAITTSLTEGLKEPLSRISDAVQSVSGNQGDAVNKLLTDVLTSFTSQMENMFGGQMRGMSEMLTQTASTIEVASQRFEQLANQFQQAGSGATDAMAKRMDDALAQMQAREVAAQSQMTAFLEQMKQSVAQGQTDSAELTMSMMKELGESTASLVRTLQEQARSTQQEHSEAQREAADKMALVLSQLESNMAKGQADASLATVQLVKELSDASARAVATLEAQSETVSRSQQEGSHAANLQLRSFLDEAAKEAARSRAAAEESTSRTLKDLADSTGATIRGLEEQILNAKNENSDRHAALSAQTAELLAKQSDQVSRLADSVRSAELAMRDTVARMNASINAHVEKMGAGAEKLYGASDRLSNNLNLMKASSDGITGSAERLTAASSMLSTSMAGVQQALGDQKAVRDSLSGMVSEFRSTMETAKREAAMTASLVDGLQRASQQLSQAQTVSVDSLTAATTAIATAHGAFAKQVEVTLREGNSAFHQELAHATSMLKGAIMELNDVVDNISAAV